MDLPKCLAQPLTTDGIFMIIHVYSLFVADFNIPQVVRIARFLDEASLKWRIASQELVRLMTAACGPFPARLLGAAQAWRSNVP
jgi:hypothetical protein